MRRVIAVNRRQFTISTLVISLLFVIGVYRYMPCLHEILSYFKVPVCLQVQAARKGQKVIRNTVVPQLDKGKNALAAIRVLPKTSSQPTAQIIQASGTQSLSISNQLTTPAGEPPVILSHFTKESPASLKPVLRWEKVKGAVVYEVQMARGEEIFEDNAYIYINGYNASLPEGYDAPSFRWRVRALNLDRTAISPYSAWETAYVDSKIPVFQRPVPLNVYNQEKGTTLLYPVYDWIPVKGAVSYEIEILNSLPARSDVRAPISQLMGRGTTESGEWYDNDKRVSTSPMYWRVRGLDAQGRPVGFFSVPQKMVTNPDDNWEVATLGDSIYHGGGSLTYSPNDWEYSFQYFLKFDSINLAQSGDTSEDTANRFEADVVPFHPRYLIIMTGSNSLRAGVDPDDVINDLETIKNKAEENGIHPIFMTLPPINPANIQKAFKEPTAEDWQERFAKVNAWIRQQVHIDLAGKIDENKELPTELATDGLHLDTDGKKLMAEAVNEQWDRVIASFGN
jgi:lysophospholipase L1-like esterase